MYIRISNYARSISMESFFVSEGDPLETFEFVEEAFDLRALLVEPLVDRRGYGAAGASLDLRGCPEVAGDEDA